MPLMQIHCRPAAKRNQIMGWTNNYLRVQLQAAAVAGRANRELIYLLGEFCQISCSAIKIIHGQTSRYKLISLPQSAVDKLKLKYGQPRSN